MTTRRESRPGSAGGSPTAKAERQAGDKATDPTPDMLTVALDALAHGLNVLPPKGDGSKAPDAERWSERQVVMATADEVRHWYTGTGRTGIGIVCGEVSGGLELF